MARSSQKKKSVYPAAIAYLSLCAFLLGGIGVLIKVADSNSQMPGDLEAAKKMKLATEASELEPSTAIPSSKNLAGTLTQIDYRPARNVTTSTFALLDGRSNDSDKDTISKEVRSKRAILEKIESAAKLPFCHFAIDYGQAYIREYAEVSDAAETLCASAIVVAKSDPHRATQILLAAARLGHLIAQDPLHEALDARVWIELSVLKSLFATKLPSSDILAALGSMPSVRESLRGELVHSRERLKRYIAMQPIWNFWMRGIGGTSLDARLIHLWRVHFEELPTDSTNLDGAIVALEKFEEDAKSRKLLRRLTHGGYVSTVRRMKEADSLRAAIATSP